MAAAVFVLQTLLLMSLDHIHSVEECVEDLEEVEVEVRVGEALCVCVTFHLCSVCLNTTDDPTYIWTRNGVNLTHTHTHTHRVHTHGTALLFLPAALNDSGIYFPHRHDCDVRNITVKDSPPDPFDMPPTQSLNPRIECPEKAYDLCNEGRGQITWYKDSQLLPGESGKSVRVLNASASDQGIYTCVCTWRYGNHTFNTSASKELKLEKATRRLLPAFKAPRNGSTVTCRLGSPVSLVCSASCGISITNLCNVSWNTHTLSGYTQNFSWEDSTNERVYHATLTITRVSRQDLQTFFRCSAINGVEWNSVTIKLKEEESLLSEVLVCVCVLLFLLSVAVAVKWFAVDLALLFRQARRIEDGKVYDAYVVYPCECVCEDALSEFISSSLPAVLEDRCGYTLFIHGRDELPGEDWAEQVERCMCLSRRLLVVMTETGSCGGQVMTTPMEAFDWQIGVHSALVQEAIRVILVQVADGHTHTHTHTQLPPGLQLLLRKSAPIRWELGSRGANSPTSRFWKRVRYMMPPPPAAPAPPARDPAPPNTPRDTVYPTRLEIHSPPNTPRDTVYPTHIETQSTQHA